MILPPQKNTYTAEDLAALSGDQELSGEDVLPGFRLSLAEVFRATIDPGESPGR